MLPKRQDKTAEDTPVLSRGAEMRARRRAFIRSWRVAHARCYAYLRWRLRAGAAV